jgi:hypothetical protein
MQHARDSPQIGKHSHHTRKQAVIRRRMKRHNEGKALAGLQSGKTARLKLESTRREELQSPWPSAGGGGRRLGGTEGADDTDGRGGCG